MKNNEFFKTFIKLKVFVLISGNCFTVIDSKYHIIIFYLRILYEKVIFTIRFKMEK